MTFYWWQYRLREGDMGVSGIAVLSFFFSSGISVIWILMCGITVSSSPAVRGFSSFWLTVFATLHWPPLSNVGQYLDDVRLNGNYYTSDSLWKIWLVESIQSIHNGLWTWHDKSWLFDRCTDQFEIFSRFLAKAEVDFWCIRGWDKKKKKTSRKRHRS